MTAYYFGDWIKEIREIFDLSQADLSRKTNNVICQSTISSWERREIKTPSIRNISIVTQSLGIPLSNVPWSYLDLEFNNEEGTRCCEVTKRFSLYDMPKATSVKTFEGQTYELKGFIGIEKDSGEVKHITDLYYRTKTVVSDSKILAKRKNEDDELIKIKGVKKLNVQNK